MKELLNSAKRFSVLFLVFAFLGCTDDDDGNLPQVVSGFTFTLNADTGTVTFINISEEANTYAWDFGDGTTSTEINPIKTFPSGTYTVSLTASNVAGSSETFEDTFTVALKEQVMLPITFDGTNVDYDATTFGGATFEVVANPDLSGTNDVASNVGAITNAGAEFEGVYFDLGTQVDLATDKTITMNFWSDVAIAVLVKLEEGTGADTEFSVMHAGTGWETLAFDFTSADKYSRLTMFVDGPGTTTGTFYIDDVEQSTTTGGGDDPVPPTMGAAAPTQAAADVISIFSDAFTDVPNGGFNNYGAAAFEQVDLSGNAVLKYTFVEGDGGGFQVIELGGDQIDAAAAGMTNFRFDLWFPNAVDDTSSFLMKLVDIPASGATEGLINIGMSSTPAMAQGMWLSFDIPFSELESNGLGAKSNLQQVVIDLMNVGEVYVDNIYFYKAGSTGGPVAPTTAAPTPMEAAADVISIFSDAYTNVPNGGFNNYGAAAFEQVDLSGNAALKYTFVEGDGGNFQVIELGGDQIDAAAAGMTNFRFDAWFPNEVDANSTFLMKVVDIPASGATEGQINIGAASSPAMAQGSWLSFDIPFTELEGNGLGGKSNIQQVVIDLLTSGEVYLDNIYFYKPAGGGGPVAPTMAAAAPSQAAADVISIFSDAYSDVPNGGFNNYGAAAFEQVDLSGNSVLKYTFVEGGGGNFQVIELGGDQIDAAAAGMTNFRFDLWFPNAVDANSTFLMKVVDIPAAGATEGQINIGPSSNPAMSQGAWLSFDIPLTELQSNGLGGTSNIQQVVIDLMTAGEVYIDNIYFYKTSGGSGSAPDFPFTFEDAGNYFGAFDNGATAANIDNPQTTGNTSSKVLELNKVLNSAWYSGVFFDKSLRDVNAPLVQTDNGTVFKVKMWSPKANINVRMRLQGDNDGDINTPVDPAFNVDVNLATANEWVTLTFDFTAQVGANSFSYEEFVIQPDLDESNMVDVNPGLIFYIDDITQE